MKRANSKSGFTLIELLTVIAIISILAAILFPVFKSVKDSAKRTNCQTNMHSIGVALQQYKLENRRCPMALLGYYDPAKTMREASGGLYPEYVKSIKGFRCPSSNASGYDDPTIKLTAYDQTGTLRDDVQYYQGDSYDYVDTTGSGGLMASYAYMWAPQLANVPVFTVSDPDPTPPPDPPAKQQRDFARQLRFTNPDASTVVTWCMNHGDKALVLFMDNSVDMIPIDRMKPTGGNVVYRILPN